MAAAVGRSEHDLVGMCRAGDLVRVRRDAYVLGGAWAAADGATRLALRTRALMAGRAGPDVASHQAALALHGLPVYGVPVDVVDLRGPVNRVRLASGLRVHPMPVGAPYVTADGYRCVPVPVAVAQVTVRSGLVPGLVPLDRALHDGRCSLDDVAAALDALARRPAERRRGEALLRLADPACESVGETRTRLLLHDLGFEPHSQVQIRDEWGALVGRVDFLVGERVVVEFDGLVKYAGADGRDALAAEKRREDALRALGYVVVRFTWADLDRPEHVARLIRRALAQVLHRDGVVAAS